MSKALKAEKPVSLAQLAQEAFQAAGGDMPTAANKLAAAIMADQPMPPFMLHKNAQRYIEKRLLRELWKAWRRAAHPTGTFSSSPASN